MDWDTNIVKSSMPNFASNEVVWLISIKVFQMINIAISIWAYTVIKFLIDGLFLRQLNFSI